MGHARPSRAVLQIAHGLGEHIGRYAERRVTLQQLQEGAALRSQADAASAHELEARTLLLQSQLNYIQARDEMIEAMGQTPE
ncbi:MAG TPA: hypothetical protein VI386_12090 [Candidatus Sulfotelmatobacter sp.]